jgi:hypothetical protein
MTRLQRRYLRNGGVVGSSKLGQQAGYKSQRTSNHKTKCPPHLRQSGFNCHMWFSWERALAVSVRLQVESRI